VTLTIAGAVSSYDAQAGTFTLLGVSMHLVDGATFENGTLADMASGKVIAARGQFNGTVFDVSAVSFVPPAPSSPLFLSGVAGDVTATSFTLGALTIRIAPSTVVMPPSAALANGSRVEVVAEQTSDGLVALRIMVQRAPMSMALATGAIRDFVPPALFQVSGQPVDATNAIFVGGNAAKLADGVNVRVSGTLTEGVLKAAVVRFLR
jgi:Domain of unknown function (DUF5666)